MFHTDVENVDHGKVRDMGNEDSRKHDGLSFLEEPSVLF